MKRGYFKTTSLALYIILSEIFQTLKSAPKEILNALVDAPYFKRYHEFVCFGLEATTEIFITKSSTSFYTTKSEELKKVLEDIENLKSK